MPDTIKNTVKFQKPLNILAWILAWDVMLLLKLCKSKTTILWVLVSLCFFGMEFYNFIISDSGPKILNHLTENDFKRRSDINVDIKQVNLGQEPIDVWRIQAQQRVDFLSYTVLNSEAKILDVTSDINMRLIHKWSNIFIIIFFVTAILASISKYKNHDFLIRQFTILQKFIILITFPIIYLLIMDVPGRFVPVFFHAIGFMGTPNFHLVLLYFNLKILALLSTISVMFLVHIIEQKKTTAPDA